MTRSTHRSFTRLSAITGLRVAGMTTGCAALIAALLLGACAAGDPVLSAALADAENHPRRAVPALMPYAMKGQAQAIKRLCMAWGGSIDSETNHAQRLQAFDWCRQAARAGDAQAQYELGRFYAQGIGTPASKAEALQWFMQAAEQGHKRANAAAWGLQGVSAECNDWATMCRLF